MVKLRYPGILISQRIDAHNIGCIRSMLTISQAENGRTFSLPVSEQFEVSLPENPTTGYRWFLSMDEKSGCVLMDDAFEPASNKPGAGSTRRWKFQATEPGKCNLEFLKRRSWGEPQPDAPRFSVTIEAQG